MKQRYSENFLFPQGAEDFGRSLVFPQGNLRGLGTTTEQAGTIYSFLFPQGETKDYGRTILFPQGQLHGLGAVDYTAQALADQKANLLDLAGNISDQVAALQTQLRQQERPDILTLEQAKGFLQQRGLYYPELTPEVITATVHAIEPTAYVSGGGSGYGSADGIQNKFNETLKQIDNLNAQYQGVINEVNQVQANIEYHPTALALTQQAEAEIERLQDLYPNFGVQPAVAAPAAAATAAKVAVTTNPATVTRTITTVATTTTPPPATNVTYVLDFYSNQFWLKRSDGVAIANGSAEWKSAALFIAPYNLAIANVSVTPAAAAKFASNSGTVSTGGTVATSTGVTATSGGTATGVTTTTTTNQTTGTTAVTNTATGVTATTSPVTGTTTVSTSSDTGKLALYALLGVLLLRGAIK
jgi:hypothetical protein